MLSSPHGDLARYRLGRMLGRPGGYGAVYEGECDGLQVVVKLIYGFQGPTPAQSQRLELVLDRLTAVSSPCVVPVIDYGIDKGAIGGALPWIVMPRLAGVESLDFVLARGTPIERGWAASVMLHIAIGLADLHASSLLHRDLKPGNVLVDAGGRARLIDFEILKIADVPTKTPAGDDPLGTPLYMAPEQLVGPIGPATDLWALGLVGHQLLTGRHPLLPFARHGHASVARAINTESLVSDDVPAPYDDLLRALLRKIPSARPQQADHVVAWLRDPGGVSLEPPPRHPRPVMRWIVLDRKEADAAEVGGQAELAVGAIDAVPPARGDLERLRRAASRIGADLALEPDLDERGSQTLLDLVTEGENDPVEERVSNWLARALDSPADVVVLPFADASRAGVDAAVHLLRVGARHRDAGRPTIGTVHCSVGLLQDQAQAVPLLAACSAIGLDGWRLLVDGVQPGCTLSMLRATQEAAEALAGGGLPVWVRASGVARWAFPSTPGIGLLYRAGRGLWTREGGRAAPVDERVEIDRLAGPVPRTIAARIAIVRPDLVRCSCAACGGLGLPQPGASTVIHNVGVVSRQMPRAHDPAAALEAVRSARTLRAVLAGPIGWHSEVGDLQVVARLLSERDPARRLGALLLAA